MAIKQNTLLPVLGVLSLLIVGVILYQQFSGSQGGAPAAPMKAVPQPSELPPTKGADNDNAGETLATVVASNAELRKQVADIVERNKKLEEEAARRGAARPSAGSGQKDGEFGATVDAAGQAAESLLGALPTLPTSRPGPGSQVGRRVNGGAAAPITADLNLGEQEAAPGAVAYKTVAPMGYAAFEDTRNRNQGPPSTRYVRTNASARTGTEPAVAGGAATGGAASATPVSVSTSRRGWTSPTGRWRRRPRKPRRSFAATTGAVPTGPISSAAPPAGGRR